MTGKTKFRIEAQNSHKMVIRKCNQTKMISSKNFTPCKGPYNNSNSSTDGIQSHRVILLVFQ